MVLYFIEYYLKVLFRRARMCELRGNLYATLAARRNWALPLQRLRPVPQNERTQPTSHQTEKTTGEYWPCIAFRLCQIVLNNLYVFWLFFIFEIIVIVCVIFGWRTRKFGSLWSVSPIYVIFPSKKIAIFQVRAAINSWATGWCIKWIIRSAAQNAKPEIRGKI